MKKVITFLSIFLSTQLFACPDISGSFFDADAEMVKTIMQNGCEATTWVDEEGTTTLIADGVERVLQQEGDMVAYAKVNFTATEFIIDIRMDWGGHNDFDLPVRWITGYRIDKYNNLVERIVPFKADGSVLGTEYVTFRRVK